MVDPNLRSPRALIALASLQLSRQELNDLISYFRENPSSYVRIELANIEEVIIGKRSAVTERERDTSRASDKYRNLPDIIYRIYRQMKNELDLSNLEVVYHFTEVLHLDHPNLTLPEFDAKRGLRSWLMTLTKVVTPSELLQASAKIKNYILKTKRSSWSARSEDELL